MIEFVEAHGYWWPYGSEGYCERYIKRSGDMDAALKHCPGRSIVVQAGGHCGVWPLWLANHFQTIYTFEPDAANFACLSRNVCAKDANEKIFAARGMLGEVSGPLSISRSKKNIGGHKGTREPGNIPTYSIDNLCLPVCDMIVLDVEGMEVPALKGAAATVKRCRPVLMLEDNDLGSRHGWGGSSVLHAVLNEYGYRIVSTVAKDIVAICA